LLFFRQDSEWPYSWFSDSRQAGPNVYIDQLIKSLERRLLRIVITLYASRNLFVAHYFKQRVDE